MKNKMENLGLLTREKLSRVGRVTLATWCRESSATIASRGTLLYMWNELRKTKEKGNSTT